MKKPQAEAEFRASYLPLIKKREAESGGKVDEALRRTMWNDYTDELCRAGRISYHRYATWTHPRWLLSSRI
jgi:hypothetical protein